MNSQDLVRKYAEMKAKAELEELEEVALAIMAAGVSVDQARINITQMPSGERGFRIDYIGVK